MTDVTGPLHGVKILDLTRILAGPYCTQMLGDLGAEVIKIERPGNGDDTRKFAPPFLADEQGAETSESAYFLSANRNKKSATIDFTKPAGQTLIRRLMAMSDVVVENFKTGTLEKYGLSYEDVKSDNPRLVYCSITGFGQTGPYATRPGYDFLIQGMGGIMSLTGEPDGSPQKVGVPIADLMTGMYAAVAINAAIYRAKIAGVGQFIDIGMLDTHVAWLANVGMNYLYAGHLGRLGNDHPNIVPYRPFKTADGEIIVVVGNDEQFRRFCEIAECDELVQDARFQTNEMRVRNRGELAQILEPILAARPSAFWLKELEAQNIGCGPINNLEQVFNDPQVIAREMVHEMRHSANGGTTARLLASPMKMSGTPVTYRHAPPLLGEHTAEVMSDILGLDDSEIEELCDLGVIR
ncbi:MAG: CoA transferase [Alphaproteobacteria bacterium]|nr:CoA transferase [Alphaproteobacteria bacterium]